MKKILICAYDLDLGGIEKSLINLLKNIASKYDITLLLQHYQGEFIKDIPRNVHIINYDLSEEKNVLIRKIKNCLKLFKFIILNKNKYDYAICYATYDYVSSIITRSICKNSILWIHSNYLHLYHYDIEKFNEFFDKRHVEQFKKLVFVSNEAKEDFLKIYSSLVDKSVVINNFIDSKEIIEKAKEKLKNKSKNKPIVYVGRLEEKSKGLYLLFEVAKELKENTFWLIGDGPDKDNYQRYLKQNKINNVKLLGKSKNPYKYLKEAKLVILTSKYEGFPVVILEALVLNKKVLSTINVSSNNFKLDNYIYLTKRDRETMIKDVIKVIESNSKEKFDYQKFNQDNLDLIFKLLGEE